MTLEDGKRKVLMILDEYSIDGNIIQETDSSVADINYKMNDFFDMAQKDMCSHIPVVACADITLAGTEYTNAPTGFKKYFKVWKNGKRVKPFPIINGQMYTNGATGKYRIEYIKTPGTITRTTPDTYQFEVSEEAANCLPYYVASQQLIVDLVVDYNAIWQMYLYQKSLLDTTLTGESGDGSVRQTLFGGN